MQETVSIGLLMFGAFYLLIAGAGLLKMPDLFLRMSASTKASTLGISCVLLATGIYFGSATVIVRVLLIIAFMYLTAPISAHMLARAAYRGRVKLWENTVIDELKAAQQAEK